jgi:hypothetical protein
MIPGHAGDTGALCAGWRQTITEAPHRWLLLGTFVLIVLASSAIAGVLAWRPRPGDEAASVTASDRLAVKEDIEAAIDPAPEEDVARIRVKCAECGVVESTREIVQILEKMDSGAAGGVKRGRLNEMAGKSISKHEVTVRMKDGATHQFMVANQENWRPGERVIFIEGRNRLSE